MTGLLGMVEAFIVILTFCLGFLLGNRQNRPSKCQDSPSLSVPDLSEADKQLIAEQQKALAQCMNYSMEMAYGGFK